MRGALALLIVAACGGHATPAAPVVTPPPPQVEKTIELPGDANGLYWDADEQALYFTAKATLSRWTDKDGVSEIATLPTIGEKSSFGGITRGGDAAFVIASFGFGTDGAVVLVDRKHQVTTLPNLDKARRRVGITRAPDGSLYDVYFVVNGHDHRGGLAKLDLAKGEQDIALPNLVKPVGVVATADTIYVSDQDTNSIVAWKAGAATPVASGLPSADLLVLLPDGSLVTGGKTGTISRVAADGKVSTIKEGLGEVRGLAYDPTNKRLFVVERGKPAVRVMPL